MPSPKGLECRSSGDFHRAAKPNSKFKIQNYAKSLFGHNSPGYRFRLDIRPIAHNTLYLPLEMKRLPEIKRIIKGESPLDVFHTDNLAEARKAFRELRYAYDFPYWAAREYYVRDIEDPDQTVPLILNTYQHRIIDTFLKRYFREELGRYVITKDFPACGVTTCVQAYILWSQIYRWHNHSNTCTHSELSIRQHKSNLLRYLKRDVIPPDKSIFIPKTGNCAFYNTYRSPDALRGIDFAYVHMADFSKYCDYDMHNSQRAYVAGISGVLLNHHTLIVLEGNIPRPKDFWIEQNYNPDWPHAMPIYNYPQICRNPFFLRRVVDTVNPNLRTPFIHINLAPSTHP